MPVRVHKIGAQVVARENNTFVKSQKGWKHGLILFGPICYLHRSGVMRWKAKFLRGRRGTIGICRTDVDMATYVNQTNSGWGYYQPNGKIGHGGPASQEYGEKFVSENSIVEVELDCDAQTIGFHVNGQFQGIAFRDVFYNLPDGHGLCLAISMYNAGDCIQIIDTDRARDSLGAVGTPSPRRSVRRVVPSVEVLRKHADVVAVPTAQGLALSKTRKGWNNGLLLVGGIHRHWNFQILEGTKITCGVCTGDVDLDGYVNKTNKGWGLYALYGTCGTAGPAKTRCCDPVQIGDIINVFLFQNSDPNFHTLAFAINGKKPVASYKLPINITYYGAVSLYSADDRVVVTTGTPLSKAQGEYGSTPPPVARRSIVRPTSQKSAVSPGPRLSVSSRVSSVASARPKSGPNVSSTILYCSPHVKFQDGKLIKTVKGWDDGLVLFGPAARKGLLYGKFKVFSGVRSTIGVCESDVQRQGYLNKTHKGWGYYQATGRIGNGGPAQTGYGKKYREPGSVVEVEVDIAHGTVQYWVNGESQGYAFGDPKTENQRLPRLPPSREYVIAISLFESAATVQYLGCNRDPPGGDDFPAINSARDRESTRSSAAPVIELPADEFMPPPIANLNPQKSEVPAAPESAPPPVISPRAEEEAAEDKVEDVDSKDADVVDEFWGDSKCGGTYFGPTDITAWLAGDCMLPRSVAETVGKQMHDEGFDSLLAIMSLTKQDLVEMNVHHNYINKVLATIENLSQLADCRLKHGGMEVVCEIGTFHNPGMPVMQVHIKKSDGTSFAVEATISDTVQQLKQRVSSCEHVPLEKMQLIYAGRYLENEDSLEEHAVEHDSNIYLVVTDTVASKNEVL